MMKVCVKCKLEKEESEFYRFRSSMCKCCVKIENKRAQVKYRKSVKYKESRKKYMREYRQLDCQKKRKRELNRKYSKFQNECRMSRYKNDIQYRLSRILRTRLWSALKGNFKAGSAVRDLGCTIAELKQHLEKLFQSGMTWDNYGEWHIDHKYPLSKVDLTDREQLLRVCHYTNLQPLWAGENIRKSNNIC